jgi:hypothetical protein
MSQSDTRPSVGKRAHGSGKLVSWHGFRAVPESLAQAKHHSQMKAEDALERFARHAFLLGGL